MREIKPYEIKELFKYHNEHEDDQVRLASHNDHRFIDILKKFCPKEELLEIDHRLNSWTWCDLIKQFKPSWWLNTDWTPSVVMYAKMGYMRSIRQYIKEVYTEGEQMFYHWTKLELQGFYTPSTLAALRQKQLPSESNPNLFREYSNIIRLCDSEFPNYPYKYCEEK